MLAWNKKKNTFVNLVMSAEPITVECELLYRKKQSVVMGQMLIYSFAFIALRFLTPNYYKRKLIYEGLLKENGLEEYIASAYVLQLGLLLLAAPSFYVILTRSLKIKGTITFSENYITIEWWRKFNFKFEVQHLKNFHVQFNYFKRNDTEPRTMVLGNNNILSFKRYNKSFKYEFLLQTIEEDEKMRVLFDIWESKNPTFQYHTVLADF
jgi:hypothetical protein